MGVLRTSPPASPSSPTSRWWAVAILGIVLTLLISGWSPNFGSLTARGPPAGPVTVRGGLESPAARPVAASDDGANRASPALPLPIAPSVGDPTVLPVGSHLLRAIPAAAMPPGPSLAGHLREQPVGPAAASAANLPITNDTWAGPTLAPFGGPFSVTNSYLLSAGFDYSALVNATSSGAFFFSHGMVGILATGDGGATWGVSFPGQATDWTKSTSANYGDVFEQLPEFQNVFASGGTPPPRAEELAYPMVAANATGTNAVLVAPFGPACFTADLGSCFATNAEVNTTYGAASGFAATVTTDGGASWGTPVPIYGKPWFRAAWYGAGGGCASGIYLLPSDQTTSVSLAANAATGTAYVAWTVDEWNTPANPLVCQTGVVYFSFNSLFRSAYAATSVDGGATWGAPSLVGRNTYGATASSDPLLNVHLTVGPGPSYVVTGAYDDLPNASSPGTNTAVGTFLSSNNGKTWSYKGDITIQPNLVLSSGPDWFFNGTVPWITADNWSTSSPYSGNLYLVWSDLVNGTGPPAILVSVNSGTGWSSPVVVSNPLSGLAYLNPTMSVASDGTVWVASTGVNTATGSYAPYGSYSRDGGSNWTQEFRIADQLSTPSIAPQADGPGFPAVAGTPGGASVVWTDCRVSACQLPARLSNWSAMFASVEAVGITTNAGPIHVNVTEFGNTSKLALPASVGWLSHTSVSLSAPRYLRTPNGSAFYVFASLAGASTASTDPATFTYVSGSLTVVYSVSQPASIAGDLRPQVAGANLTIAVGSDVPTHLTLTPVSGGATGSFSFGAVVPGGLTFTVRTTAPLYQTNSTTVATRSLQTSTLHIQLARTLGWIAGNVSTAVPGGLTG
ncbi:MAG: hypothetical protein L3J97_02195, partial [Thermoplasmata archaeon]|nr:hypothetical protein [Thermoplasmata archaeon]